MASKKNVIAIVGASTAIVGTALSILWSASIDRPPNSGLTGAFFVYKPLAEGPTEDGLWRVEVEELPTPAKSTPREILIDTATRDYLVRGDVLTMEEGVVVSVDYRDHTDVPGGERRQEVMTPYSQWSPEERMRYQ